MGRHTPISILKSNMTKVVLNKEELYKLNRFLKKNAGQVITIIQEDDGIRVKTICKTEEGITEDITDYNN